MFNSNCYYKLILRNDKFLKAYFSNIYHHILGKVEKKHKAYEEPVKSEPTIIPNYLANPVFPYSSTTPSYSDNTDHQYINESSEFYGKPKSELISVNNGLMLCQILFKYIFINFIIFMLFIYINFF